MTKDSLLSKLEHKGKHYKAALVAEYTGEWRRAEKNFEESRLEYFRDFFKKHGITLPEDELDEGIEGIFTSCNDYYLSKVKKLDIETKKEMIEKDKTSSDPNRALLEYLLIKYKEEGLDNKTKKAIRYAAELKAQEKMSDFFSHETGRLIGGEFLQRDSDYKHWEYELTNVRHILEEFGIDPGRIADKYSCVHGYEMLKHAMGLSS